MDLDVRPIPANHRHTTIFDAFRRLSPGERFVLVNDHDPLPLRDQFEVNFARSFTWAYEEAGPRTWRVRITKTASTPLPQVLANTTELATTRGDGGPTGAVWKIPVAERDLDTNIIALDPAALIPSHAGPDIDVMHVIIAGGGTIVTESDELAISTGDIVWLPKFSRREIRAGATGLRYLTVHVHKTGLRISPKV